MDFIERIFGVSPDGGSGFDELVLVLVLFWAVCFVAFLRRRWLRR